MAAEACPVGQWRRIIELFHLKFGVADGALVRSVEPHPETSLVQIMRKILSKHLDVIEPTGLHVLFVNTWQTPRPATEAKAAHITARPKGALLALD